MSFSFLQAPEDAAAGYVVGELFVKDPDNKAWPTLEVESNNGEAETGVFSLEPGIVEAVEPGVAHSVKVQTPLSPLF